MISDLFYFENPEIIPIVIGLLVFILSYASLSSKLSHLERSSNIIISLVFSLFTAGYLYKNPDYLQQSAAPYVLAILALVIILFILRSFFRFFRRQFR